MKALGRGGVVLDFSSRQAGKFVSLSLSVLKFGVVLGGGGGGGGYLPGEDGRGGADPERGGVGLGGGGDLYLSRQACKLSFWMKALGRGGVVLDFSSRQAGKFVSFSLSVLKFGVVLGGGYLSGEDGRGVRGGAEAAADRDGGGVLLGDGGVDGGKDAGVVLGDGGVDGGKDAGVVLGDPAGLSSYQI